MSQFIRMTNRRCTIKDVDSRVVIEKSVLNFMYEPIAKIGL